MKKNTSAWNKKVLMFALRCRRVMTFGAVLQVWSVVQQYKRHDVAGFPWLPSAWVLPYLTFGCVGACVYTTGIWVMYFYKQRQRE